MSSSLSKSETAVVMRHTKASNQDTLRGYLASIWADSRHRLEGVSCASPRRSHPSLKEIRIQWLCFLLKKKKKKLDKAFTQKWWVHTAVGAPKVSGICVLVSWKPQWVIHLFKGFSHSHKHLILPAGGATFLSTVLMLLSKERVIAASRSRVISVWSRAFLEVTEKSNKWQLCACRSFCILLYLLLLLSWLGVFLGSWCLSFLPGGGLTQAKSSSDIYESSLFIQGKKQIGDIFDVLWHVEDELNIQSRQRCLMTSKHWKLPHLSTRGSKNNDCQQITPITFL